MDNWKQAPPERRSTLDRWLYALSALIIWLIAAIDLAATEAEDAGTSVRPLGCAPEASARENRYESS